MTAERPCASFDLVQDLVVTSIEGRRATEHDVKHHSDTPHVTLFGVVAGEDLGGDIVGCAVHLVHGVGSFISIVMGSSKVDNLDGTTILSVNEDILGLQITMGNASTVAVGDGLHDLLDNVSTLVFAEKTTRSNLFEELATITKLSDKVDATLVLVDFVKTNDVGMVQILENIDLVLQTDPLSLIKVQLVDDLNSSEFSVRSQSRFLDLSECTFAKEFVVVDIVFLDEQVHVIVLDHKVLVSGDNVCLGPVDSRFVNRNKVLKQKATN